LLPLKTLKLGLYTYLSKDDGTAAK
jgi:hypothetical protein